MLFGMTACLFCIAGTNAVDISFIVSISVVLLEASSSVIFNNPSHFDSVSKLFPQY